MRNRSPGVAAVIIVLASSWHTAYAQPHKSFGLTGGIRYGYWTKAEAGVAYASESGVHSKWGYSGWKLTGVIEASHARSIGVELGCWTDGLLAFGLNLGYYTDFTQSQIILRPDMQTSCASAIISNNAKLLKAL